MARTFPEFAPRVVPAVIEYLLHAQVVLGASCQGYSMMCWCIVQCPCMNETFSKIQPILRDGNWQRINSRKRTTTARNFHLSMKRFFLLKLKLDSMYKQEFRRIGPNTRPRRMSTSNMLCLTQSHNYTHSTPYCICCHKTIRKL